MSTKEKPLTGKFIVNSYECNDGIKQKSCSHKHRKQLSHKLERNTRLELATSTLARWRSTR